MIVLVEFPCKHQSPLYFGYLQKVFFPQKLTDAVVSYY